MKNRTIRYIRASSPGDVAQILAAHPRATRLVRVHALTCRAQRTGDHRDCTCQPRLQVVLPESEAA